MGVPDLSRVGPRRMPAGPSRDKALAGAELEQGMRCSGCGRRIEDGIICARITVNLDGAGRAKPRTQRRSACSRKDCDYMPQLVTLSTVMEITELRWLAADPDPTGELTLSLVGRPKFVAPPAPAEDHSAG